MIALLYTYCGQKYIVLIVCDREGDQYVVQLFFFGISHAFVRVTAVTRDCLVRNSGFEAQIIADLRAILEVLPGQRYRGASGGLPPPSAQKLWLCICRPRCNRKIMNDNMQRC